MTLRAGDREVTEVRTVVTVQHGSKTRRYVVVPEDEHLLNDYVSPTLPTDEHERRSHLAFGAQWLRGKNRVDEAYRTLSLSEVVSVTRQQITLRWGW